MQKYYFLLVVFLSALIITNTNHLLTDIEAKGENLEAQDIIGMIDSGDSRTVVRNLFSNVTTWNTIIRNIESGDPQWLNVAMKLRTHSDAGATDTLNYAVSEALIGSPETVLRMSKEIYGLDAICGCPDIDNNRYGTYEKAEEEIFNRIAAVKSVKATELSSDKKYCIKRLTESIDNLKRFYGK